MRSRSHRMTSSDPPDDWVDGSWTVDCVCGVNFDDGEEMVNCDECGVWVHTRCSRYVKSEKSFACDKCKSKNSRNDSEETEVAQLLVELPTKTMRMESSYHHLSSDPPRRPFRLWTEKPMEERVHVQGIPGGDPSLFGGLSSVFTPELWKCAGYVPKKFNFQYREFPCWDNNEASTNIEQEIENPIDKGANMLFSLSKETVLATPLPTLVGMKGRSEEGNGDRELSSKETKKWDGDNLDIRHSQKHRMKERGLLGPLEIYSSQPKKEDLGTSKDWRGKKRARALVKGANIKNRGVHSPKSAVRRTNDAKESEFHENKVPKFIRTDDSQSIISANLRNTMTQETLSGGKILVENNTEKLENKLAANEHSLEAFKSNMSRNDYSVGAGMKEEKAGHQVFASIETSSKSNAMTPLVVSNDNGSIPLKEEGVSMSVDDLDSNGGCLSTTVVIESQKSKPSVGDTDVVAPKVEEFQAFEDSDAGISHSSLQPNAKVETEAGHYNSIVDLKHSSPLVEEKLDDPEDLVRYTGISADHMPESSKLNNSVLSVLQSSDDKAEAVERRSEAVSDCLTHKLDELSGDRYLPNQEVKGVDGCMAMPKSSSEPNHDSREAEDQSTSGEPVLIPPISSQRKMVVCFGKSSSTPSTIVISKSSISDNGKSENTQTPNPIAKQRVALGSSSSSIKKEHVARDVVNDGNGQEIPRKFVKERSKSSVSSALKTLHSSRTSHSSVSRHTSSDSKDPVAYTSSKSSSAQNAAVALGSTLSSGTQRSLSASQGQNNITSSGSLQRGEMLNHSSGHPSSKINLTPATHTPAPSNSRATLSDEELALLLHQELNSSPRVPRVPRVRQGGSLPQLASPTATSMLKRTSSFGGKDHSSFSRRKVKDAKGGSRNTHELDDEAKKTDRVHSSPDQRRQYPASAVDYSNRKEVVNGSPEEVNLMKKNIRTTSSLTANSGTSSSTEATGQCSPSVRNSPRNISDDDTGTVGGLAHRTLPGLINEIMSKGQRMTYEELCNAVLPHWKSLRKHNGERYAYSSHFQAVLDCLRNRTEWAQLVDRGPKTNASRKRRKMDSEQLSFESEDKHSKGSTAKEVESKILETHREEFPKGKRNARKRRRLALQGRGIKDVRKRGKADLLTDDDFDAFSNSSEESMFSEEEFQGGGTCPVENEASASSDETGAM